MNLNLTNVSDKYLSTLEKRTEVIKNNIAEDLFENLIYLTPVKTGYARSRWTLNKDTGVDVISNDAEYLKFVNDGTENIAPRRFIERAITITKNKIGNKNK